MNSCGRDLPAGGNATYLHETRSIYAAGRPQEPSGAEKGIGREIAVMLGRYNAQVAAAKLGRTELESTRLIPPS
jgi:hypothetical protein